MRNFFPFADMDKNKHSFMIYVWEIMGKLIELSPNIYQVSKALFSLYIFTVNYIVRRPHGSLRPSLLKYARILSQKHWNPQLQAFTHSLVDSLRKELNQNNIVSIIPREESKQAEKLCQ